MGGHLRNADKSATSQARKPFEQIKNGLIKKASEPGRKTRFPESRSIKRPDPPASSRTEKIVPMIMKYIIRACVDHPKPQRGGELFRERSLAPPVELDMPIKRIARTRAKAVTRDILSPLDEGIGQPMHLTGYAVRRVGGKLF